MIDFHTHTTFSDGELIPSELARRASVKGIKVLGITDHADLSNIEFIVPAMIRIAHQLNQFKNSIRIIPGVELTHIPPELICEMVAYARGLGAKLVIVHGETLVEPVAPGTNMAAIDANADILAHPGLITEEEASLAAEKGIYLEITARKGHCLTNGHVAQMAKKFGCKLVINSDAHAPGDLIDKSSAEKILLGAGLNPEEVKEVFNEMQKLSKKLLEG